MLGVTMSLNIVFPSRTWHTHINFQPNRYNVLSYYPLVTLNNKTMNDTLLNILKNKNTYALTDLFHPTKRIG